MRSTLCLLLLLLSSCYAQHFNLRKSSAGLKETLIIESMRAVDTDQDVISQLLTVDHDIKATTKNKIMSFDLTQANLSEQLKETESTSSDNNNNTISPLERQALPDQYHSTDMPEWNDVHGGTHEDYSNIPFAERQTLQDLYESTDGAHWNYGSSSAGIHWSFDDPAVNPCADVGWYGVHCIDNRITGLSLVGINMIGTIPESMSQLTLLMHLDLGGNLLIGRVPSTLCQIKSLVRVDLVGSSITCYPQCLEHIAVEVKVHPSTPVCNIIPSRSSLSDSTADISSSSLTLVKKSSNNHNISLLERQVLQELYDSTDGPNWYYRDYGDIPWDFSNPDANPCDEQWYGITCSADYHITYLVLHSDLAGTIPSTIGQLSYLYYLSISYSQYLMGTIPSTIGQLSSLRYLFLIDNRLTGSIPSTIGLLSSLQYLYLSYNGLTGTIPSTIGQLSPLNFLDLSYNQFTGFIPSTIGQLSSLQTLYLHENLLTGIIPSTIGLLYSLKILSIGANNLMGTIPSTIGQLSSLQHLGLYNTQISGTIPRTIGQLMSLKSLFLTNNRLTGMIPSSLCKLNLTSINLDYNDLRCKPACLLSRVGSLYAGYISVCLSEQPSQEPTAQPTVEPSGPSAQPTEEPTAPSAQPTEKPSAKPTAEPSAKPTVEPSAESTEAPSAQSSELPTVDTSSSQSTQAPTSSPSTATPTVVPTAQPFEAVVE